MAVQFVPGLDVVVDGAIGLEALEATEAGAEAAETAAAEAEGGGVDGFPPFGPEDMDEGRKPGCCFSAGTLGHTDHGEVPIEQIAVGNNVLSSNRTTGVLEYKPVVALTPQHQDALVDLTVDGENEVIKPSVSHPFWVERGSISPATWMAAGQMQAGDLVQTIQGNWKQVISSTREAEPQTVYNFTVDENHDYFVGKTGFLVHNASNCQCGSRRAAFRMAKRLLGVAMSAIPQVFGPGSPGYSQFGLNPSQNGRLYLFGSSEGAPAIREDFPAEYPSGPPQGPHFNYGEFDPENPKSLDGHCNF